jgi:hypothetical protein
MESYWLCTQVVHTSPICKTSKSKRRMIHMEKLHFQDGMTSDKHEQHTNMTGVGNILFGFILCDTLMVQRGSHHMMFGQHSVQILLVCIFELVVSAVCNASIHIYISRCKACSTTSVRCEHASIGAGGMRLGMGVRFPWCLAKHGCSTCQEVFLLG